MTLFTEIALIIVIAAAAGFVAHLLNQPTMLGFIVAGLGIGAWGALELSRLESIGSLASIGVALLLFIVGLEMDFRYLKHVGIPSLVVGLGQVIFTFAAGFFILTFLGFSNLASLYIAAALTFSSTIIGVKLLSEKRELSSLHGRIAVGVLLVQDAVAVLALIFLSGLGAEISYAGFVKTALLGSGFIGLTVLASKLLPKILDLIGSSTEMLYLFSLAWVLGVATLVASPLVGLSIEIGGLLAGLALAGSSEHYQIASRLRPLRDFFLILFFVGLGASLMGSADFSLSMPAVWLSLFVLVGNPLIVMVIMGLLGYASRTSLMTGLVLAQISEFSLILVALGYKLGHLTQNEVALVTLIGIITIFLSAYLFNYGEKIYRGLKPLLKIFELRKSIVESEEIPLELTEHVVLVGAHRMGSGIIRALTRGGLKFAVVDLNPFLVKSWKGKNVPAIYGDITDSDIQELVGLNQARLVISTAPDMKDNLTILSLLKERNPKGRVILTGDSEYEAKTLYAAGADYVILPHFLGGEEIANLIAADRDLGALEELRKRDLILIEESKA